MNTTRIAGGLILSAGLLLAAGQAEAEWRYVDDKGRSRTVVLKMDVPAQYANSAVYVGADSGLPSRAPEAAAPAREPDRKAGALVPGAQWWTYPAGSPERAAAKLAAEQRAAELRERATQGGVPR